VWTSSNTPTDGTPAANSKKPAFAGFFNDLHL
jgi:hypothetical protein